MCMKFAFEPWSNKQIYAMKFKIENLCVWKKYLKINVKKP